MIIYFLIFALFSANPEGTPIDTSIPQYHYDAVEIYLRDNPTNSHFGTRGRNSIIVSCLTTIVACTWTTIHPNVPAPGESRRNLLRQRLVTWIYALLAPEAITAWAMRQCLGALRIKNHYNEYFKDEISMCVDLEYKTQWTHSLIENPLQKRPLMEKISSSAREWLNGSPVPERIEEGEMRPWTITHGFFVQMGGFMRSEKGKPISCYRKYSDLRKDIKGKRIDAPTTTETEIQHRSKGDALSKTIVILQTTWFIAQCIARWSAHLPVTELEVVTLGFAMLNALTYGLWWYKPQSVGVPVFLETKPQTTEEGIPADGQWNGEAGEHSTAVVVEAEAGDIVRKGTTVRWRTIWEGVEGFWRNPRATRTAEVPKKEVPMKQRSFIIRQLVEDILQYPPWQLVWRMPYALVLAVLRPLAKLLQFTQTHFSKWDLRVAMFHTYGPDDDETVFVASSIIASLFGLVHFIPAWFLDFPSPPERILWRSSAAIITGQPIILGAWAKWTRGFLWEDEYKSAPLGIAILNTVPLYILARLILLILACLSLRRLSSDQLITIEWISFVPHL